jgi:hypothetical protein
MARPKPLTDGWQRSNAVSAALHHLTQARDCLIEANAPQALKRVRAAIKSAEGARRHANNHWLRRDIEQDWSVKHLPACHSRTKRDGSCTCGAASRSVRG